MENTICEQFFALCSSPHYSRIFDDTLAVNCVSAGRKRRRTSLKLCTHRLDICRATAILDICTAESCVSFSCGDFFLTRNSMNVRCRNDAELRLFPSRLVFVFINYLFYFPFSFSHFVHIYIFHSRSQKSCCNVALTNKLPLPSSNPHQPYWLASHY